MSMAEARQYIKLVPGWKLMKGKVAREFKFRDFAQALGFVNRVGAIAEEEGHHPDITIFSWNRVRLELYTHAIKGLSTNDFIVAAKVNRLLARSP